MNQPGLRRRCLTFLLAIALQRAVRPATAAPPAPVLHALATQPQRLSSDLPDATTTPRIVAAAGLTLLFLRLPGWVGTRPGWSGLGLRVVLLAAAFDAWAGPRAAAAIADDLDSGDLPGARRHLQHLTRDALPAGLGAADVMSAQEIADRTTHLLAGSAADNAVGPWIAYALFDLPGAVAYHLPVLLTILWGQIPGALMRLPLIGRVAGAGPRFAVLRAAAGRAAGLAYAAAAPAIGADPRDALRAALHADDPAPAAAGAAIDTAAAGAATDPAAPSAATDPNRPQATIRPQAEIVRRAVRLHRAALVIAAAATLLLLLTVGRRTLPRSPRDEAPA